MSTLAPTPLLPPPPTPAPTPSANTTLAADLNTFLELLTTQLQNQDPLEPVDTETFTQQLVQFSQVEQQIQTNDLLESLIAQTAAASATSAIGFLGQIATFDSNAAVLPAEGQIDFEVTTPIGAVRADAFVRDATGRVVFSAALDPAQLGGAQTFSFDGALANGDQLPPGLYSLEVQAFTADDTALQSQVNVRETITGVDLSGQSPLYLTASGPRPFEDILGLTAP